MELAREHVEATNGTKSDMCKINSVRKHKGLFLTFESLGMRGLTLTRCSRNNLEVVSVNLLPIESAKRSRDSKGDRINKSSFKTRNDFMQWLRHRKVTALKDFKAASQFRWQHDENEDKSCTKMNEKEHDGHVHDKSDMRRKVCVCKFLWCNWNIY